MFDLNGINGIAPMPTIISRLSLLRYALSALISSMTKFSAVARVSGSNCGQSPVFFSSMKTAVTTCVFVPTHRWALTQWACCRLTPYFSSTHLT